MFLMARANGISEVTLWSYLLFWLPCASLPGIYGVNMTKIFIHGTVLHLVGFEVMNAIDLVLV